MFYFYYFFNRSIYRLARFSGVAAAKCNAACSLRRIITILTAVMRGYITILPHAHALSEEGLEVLLAAVRGILIEAASTCIASLGQWVLAGGGVAVSHTSGSNLPVALDSLTCALTGSFTEDLQGAAGDEFLTAAVEAAADAAGPAPTAFLLLVIDALPPVSDSFAKALARLRERAGETSGSVTLLLVDVTRSLRQTSGAGPPAGLGAAYARHLGRRAAQAGGVRVRVLTPTVMGAAAEGKALASAMAPIARFTLALPRVGDEIPLALRGGPRLPAERLTACAATSLRSLPLQLLAGPGAYVEAADGGAVALLPPLGPMLAELLAIDAGLLLCAGPRSAATAQYGRWFMLLPVRDSGAVLMRLLGREAMLLPPVPAVPLHAEVPKPLSCAPLMSPPKDTPQLAAIFGGAQSSSGTGMLNVDAWLLTDGSFEAVARRGAVKAMLEHGASVVAGADAARTLGDVNILADMCLAASVATAQLTATPATTPSAAQARVPRKGSVLRPTLGTTPTSTSRTQQDEFVSWDAAVARPAAISDSRIAVSSKENRPLLVPPQSSAASSPPPVSKPKTGAPSIAHHSRPAPAVAAPPRQHRFASAEKEKQSSVTEAVTRSLDSNGIAAAASPSAASRASALALSAGGGQSLLPKKRRATAIVFDDIEGAAIAGVPPSARANSVSLPPQPPLAHVLLTPQQTSQLQRPPQPNPLKSLPASAVGFARLVDMLTEGAGPSAMPDAEWAELVRAQEVTVAREVAATAAAAQAPPARRSAAITQCPLPLPIARHRAAPPPATTHVSSLRLHTPRGGKTAREQQPPPPPNEANDDFDFVD